jgi:histidinol-phosphate phosphatase family protein
MKNFSLQPGTAVFVDRDGTLNQDSGYVTSPEQLVLFPGVPEAIARLNDLGIKVIMVTNQSAIGRGMMTMQDLENIHARLDTLIRPFGASIDGIFSCPHHPQDHCVCRKPNTGLIYEAVDRFSLDLSRCYLVGDKLSDLEVAQKVAVPGILVLTSPYSACALQARDQGQVSIEYVADSFAQAVVWIEQDLLKGVNQTGPG